MSDYDELQLFFDGSGRLKIVSKEVLVHQNAIQQQKLVVSSKQNGNSRAMAAAVTELEDLEEEKKGIKSAKADLEAQEATVTRKIQRQEKVVINGKKQEAVMLSDEEKFWNKYGHMINHLNEDASQRVLGSNGNNDVNKHNVLQAICSTYSRGDAKNDSAANNRLKLSVAAIGGMETDLVWKSKWESPPEPYTRQGWIKLAGKEPGTILCNNGVGNDQAVELLTHLFQLTPVDAPSPQAKKRRGRGSSFSGKKKARRMSAEEQECIDRATEVMRGVASGEIQARGDEGDEGDEE